MVGAGVGAEGPRNVYLTTQTNFLHFIRLIGKFDKILCKGEGARDAYPICFIFMRFSEKILPNNSFFPASGIGAPLSAKSKMRHCIPKGETYLSLSFKLINKFKKFVLCPQMKSFPEICNGDFKGAL